jgi:hypothetical protein
MGRLRVLIPLVMLFAVGMAKPAFGSSSATYSVGDVSTSTMNSSTILVNFNVDNKGSTTGTPYCTISAPGLTSESVLMKPVKSGNTEIVPGYPFEVPAGDTHPSLKVSCSTRPQQIAKKPGKPSYSISRIAIAPLGNTILQVSFKLTNTSSFPGVPTCEATLKGNPPGRVDLKAFGSIYSATLNPHVTDAVKDASIVVTNAKAAVVSNVAVTCN